MASMWTKFSRQQLKLLHFTALNESVCRNSKLMSRCVNLKRFTSHFRYKILLKSRKSLCSNKILSHSSHGTTTRLSPNRCSFFSTKSELDLDKRPVDPYSLVEAEIAALSQCIKEELRTTNTDLNEVAEYYFDGKGKAFRPMLVMLMAKALNFHVGKDESLLPPQQQISMIAEMIHTASLMHDDVIDVADTRRGKTSINLVWGQRKSILAGDYVMSMASMALARIRNEEVVSVVSQITEDLVRGEFMQLGSKENEDERFTHYITKTFKKTASLLANSCQAVAVLSKCDQSLANKAYEYGKHIGISFQLIDDLLDFTSCDHVMGKPTAADLRLGLATAPVLFAAKKYPELNALIMRRFAVEGDVEKAREYVAKSNGVAETRLLAEHHSQEAVKQINTLNQSDSLKALEIIAKLVLTRNK